jgi:hypothetical protein
MMGKKTTPSDSLPWNGERILAIWLVTALALSSGCAYRFGSIAPPDDSMSERRLVARHDVATLDDQFEVGVWPDAGGGGEKDGKGEGSVRSLRIRIWYPSDSCRTGRAVGSWLAISPNADTSWCRPTILARAAAQRVDPR